MKTKEKERPILFSSPMVRAILDGRKTQTRRVVKFGALKPGTRAFMRETIESAQSPEDVAMMANYIGNAYACPYGQPGDRLWLRETWQYGPSVTPGMIAFGKMSRRHVVYLADMPEGQHPPSWRPSIFMPRWASRITLEVVSVRVERLQDITDDDAIAEGAALSPCQECEGTGRDPDTGRCELCSGGDSYVEGYRKLWESINGPGSWASNPWVWVVEFKRIGGDA